MERLVATHASIMPEIRSANTNLPTTTIAKWIATGLAA